MKLILMSIIFVVTGILIGYYLKLNYNYERGYVKGKIDFAIDITNEIGLKVNSKTIENNNKYKYYKDIKDIRLYIYEVNGIKTIVINEDNE